MADKDPKADEVMAADEDNNDEVTKRYTQQQAD